MFKRLLAAACLFVCLPSTATVISYKGYERDTGGTCSQSQLDCQYNIVKTQELEWLKWDVTKAASVNSALSKFSANGWAVATNVQMLSLLNTFQFGKTNWSIPLNKSIISQQVGWNQGETSIHNTFMDLFGFTLFSSCSSTNQTKNCYSESDPYKSSSAYFGDINTNSPLYSSVMILDDNSFITTANPNPQAWTNHVASITGNSYPGEFSTMGNSVALVRVRSSGATTVNSPATIGLFGIALVALGIRRRKVVTVKS